MFRDLRLRASPWIALFGGIAYLGWVVMDKRSAVTFQDIYPGLLVLVASAVLFAMVLFCKRPVNCTGFGSASGGSFSFAGVVGSAGVPSCGGR